MEGPGPWHWEAGCRAATSGRVRLPLRAAALELALGNVDRARGGAHLGITSSCQLACADRLLCWAGAVAIAERLVVRGAVYYYELSYLLSGTFASEGVW